MLSKKKIKKKLVWVSAANFNYVGEKCGASAKAAVKAEGAQLQAANVNVQGKDSSVSAQATVHTCAASMQAANVNISPQGGTHLQATADFTAGMDVGNVNIGKHRGGGIGISTRAQIGNVGLSFGPPNLVFGPGLNLGFGGGPASSEGGREAKVGKGTLEETGVTETLHMMATPQRFQVGLKLLALDKELEKLRRQVKHQAVTIQHKNMGYHQVRTLVYLLVEAAPIKAILSWVQAYPHKIEVL